MPRGRSLSFFRDLIGLIRRRKLVAGAVLIGLVAVAVAVPLAMGGPAQGPAAPIFHAEGCNTPPAINPPSTAAAAGSWGRLSLPAEAACAKLTPSRTDASGIAVDSSFLLAASEPIDAVSIRRRLIAEPAVPFDVRTDSPTKHRVIPKDRLAPGTVYRFALLDAPGGRPVQRWAFQTHSPLRVVATLPSDRATDVPLNIGIEMTFSHDGVDGAEERFSVSPRTEGHLEVHKRVLVFVPKSLKARTLYTVTLSPGASVAGSKETIREPFRFRFETGAHERTGSTPGEPELQFGRAVWESATADPPVVSFFSLGSGGRPTALPMTVHRFDGVDTFLGSLTRFTSIPSWAGSTRSRYVAPTKGLRKVLTFRGRLQSLGDQGDLYVRFPDRMPAGFYLVRTRHAGVPIQAWLQVTDVASYAAVSEGRTLLWANDVASKKAIHGAVVRVAGGVVAGRTNADGIAAFPTPKRLLTLRPDPLGQAAEAAGNLVVTAGDGRLAVVPLADIFSGFHSFEFREYAFSGDPSAYWRFLYADRNLYRPTDTVRFWGLMRRRTGPPGEQPVTVELQNPYDETARGSTRIASTTVRTTPRGTFIGELPFAAVSPGYYELIARVGDQTIAQTSFVIEDFVKPSYVLDVSSSKKAVLSGETVTYGVSASFLEGSPVPTLDLNYTLGDDGEKKSITTDGLGRASVRDRPVESRITWTSIGVFPALVEEGEISGGASVQVFPSTLALEATSLFVGNRVRVDGTVFGVDFAKLNSDEASDPFDYRGAPARGRRVTATVTEVSWRRTQTGTTYDFIAKIARPVYDYQEIRRARGTFSDTSDSRGRFSMAFAGDTTKTYAIDLRVSDSSGRAYTDATYAYSGFEVGSFFPHMAGLTAGPYAVGDAVSVAMRQGQDELPSGGANRYLFYTAAGGIREAAVRTSPRYSFRFSEADVPNVDLVAVRFNGVTYQETAGSYQAQFDVELRRLRIVVTPDRARYRPGETATLAVRVTDQRGRPVRAEVLLSAVDEALFRVHPDYFFSDRDILTTLYEPISSGVLRAYASHQFPTSYGGAERGGEGGDRTNFRDVGIFTTVLTDADGRARAPFKLPDNLTSWRVTTLAITDRLQAGAATTLVPVGLPVFVDAGLNESYLTSDRPSVRVRAFGADLEAGERATFRVEAPSLSSKPFVASGVAFRPVDIPLPPLREGRHRISISVTAGGKKDTLVRTISVVSSRLLRVRARTDEVAAGSGFSSVGRDDGYTSVVISDRNRGRYYPALEELTWTYGDRVDQMLARNLSQELLTKYFGETAPFPALFRPGAYQTQEGGIAIFPFADQDLALSARVAALAPERFGRQGLSAYFGKVLADRKQTRERGIIALYGAAALGEPVLPDVHRAAAEKDLSVRERLYVAMAELELGDEPSARAIYRDVLQRYGEVRGATVRLNVGRDQDDILEASSLAAILGAGLGDDASAAIFDYTTANATSDILVGLEQISFLQAALPRLPNEPSRVAYTVDGKRVTKDLARGESVALTLSAAERHSLDLRVLEGRVAVATSYLAPFGPKDIRSDPDVTITRSWGGASTGTKQLRDGDLVRIQIDYTFGRKALGGCYQVTDMLPSGLRAVTRPWARGIEEMSISYPYAIEGQRVSFCVQAKGPQHPIVYYARVIGLGSYTAEPALIQAQRGPERADLTGAIRVVIG